MAGRLGVVYILAPDTVQLGGFLVGSVCLTHWQQRVGMAEDSGALAKVGLLILV